MLGECLAALTTCFPVAFLEPELSAHNPRSIAYNTEEADYSFEARGRITNFILLRMTQLR